MASECGIFIAKYVLCLFNFIFFIMGTLLLGIGTWLAVDKSSLIALLKMVESEQIKEFTQPRLIEHLSYVLIVIGVIMFAMSFMGYCGAIRESRCLLAAYGAFMIILLVTEIVTGGLAAFYKEKTRAETKNFLQSTISSFYSTGEHTDAVTLMWNQMMASFSCCGVDDMRDFETSPSWMANRGNRSLPEACCILKDVSNIIPRDDDCVTNPSESNSFYKKGCYDVFADWIVSHREIILGILVSVCFIHAFAIFLAFCLCRAFGKYDGMRL